MFQIPPIFSTLAEKRKKIVRIRLVLNSYIIPDSCLQYYLTYFQKNLVFFFNIDCNHKSTIKPIYNI